MPVGVWDGGEQRLRLDSTGSIPYVGTWQSPVYDLRPELRGTCKNAGQTLNGGAFSVNQTNMIEAIPIWGARGGVLWVQVTGLNTYADSLLGLKVDVEEKASPNYVSQLLRFTDRYDVSDNLQSSDKKPCAILEFNPLGQGSPIRFWQLTIKFKWSDPAIANEPIFGLRASFY